MEEDKNSNNKKMNKEFIKIEISHKNLNMKKRKVKTWSNEEDEMLLHYYDEHPKKWNLIAEKMKDRNQNQCLHRYRRLTQLGVCKKIWSAKQDQMILSLMKNVGKNWKVLAQILGTKSGKQIRQRFINKLDPQIKNDEWTQEEDQLIVKYYSQLGSKWSEISKKIPGRPENKVKNRFYSYIQKHYEIKYIHFKQEEELKQTKRKEQRKEQRKQQRKELKQIVFNSKQGNTENNRSTKLTNNQSDKNIKQTKIQIEKNQSKKQLISIKQIEEELGGYGNKDDIFDSNVYICHKYGLQSLIKVDEEAPSQNRYRSGRNLVSNNQIQNQNDLFYLSHN